MNPIDDVCCTVSFTNSQGVTFSATESTCVKAYEQIMMFVEASDDN